MARGQPTRPSVPESVSTTQLLPGWWGSWGTGSDITGLGLAGGGWGAGCRGFGLVAGGQGLWDGGFIKCYLRQVAFQLVKGLWCKFCGFFLLLTFWLQSLSSPQPVGGINTAALQVSIVLFSIFKYSQVLSSTLYQSIVLSSTIMNSLVLSRTFLHHMQEVYLQQVSIALVLKLSLVRSSTIVLYIILVFSTNLQYSPVLLGTFQYSLVHSRTLQFSLVLCHSLVLCNTLQYSCIFQYQSALWYYLVLASTLLYYLIISSTIQLVNLPGQSLAWSQQGF